MAFNTSDKYKKDLEDLYQEYLKAEITILRTGEEYTIKDRTLKRPDLKFIAEQKRDIASELAKIDSGRKVRVKRVLIRWDT